jgi:hypothetical protein
MALVPAISLYQPWASLCVLGKKRCETRDYPTRVRGKVFIHAAMRFDKWQRELAYDEPFIGALKQSPAAWNTDVALLYEPPLPLGCILGMVDIVDCFQMPTDDSPLPIELYNRIHDGHELAFGDYTPGRWAWLLDNPVAFRQPVPCKGHQKFWYPEQFLINQEWDSRP